MYFKQFLHDDTGCSSYLIASRESREAAVVDPQYDIEQYVHLAEDRGYTTTSVVDTHLHADHISGNRRLAAATGAALYLHESADVLFPFRPMRDGDVLHLGQVDLHVVHTPGHRPEEISLLVVNPPRSPEPSMVLSGDTLFVGDVGRPDFGGPGGGRDQFNSVQRLLQLQDYVEVFPAHFEGSCGKGMCGRPSSTIGFERRFNTVLLLSEDDFLKYEETVPARPLNMSAVMDTNRGAADHSWLFNISAAEVASISTEEAATWLRENDAFILDVRDPWEYVAGHLPGAVSLPQADLGLQLAKISKAQQVLVVCAGGNRSLAAGGFLKGSGFERITNLEGGTNGWRAAGYPIETGET